MKLRWLTAALTDLRAIKTHLAEYNPIAAQYVVDSIRNETQLLTQQPAIGRLGRLPDTRELLIQHYPYIVAYRAQADEIHILAVVHTSRRWPDGVPNQ